MYKGVQGDNFCTLLILTNKQYKEVLNIIYYVLDEDGYTLDSKLNMCKDFIHGLTATEHEKRKLYKHVHYYIWGVIEYGEKYRKYSKENDYTG